jgi:hypothetical protein
MSTYEDDNADLKALRARYPLGQLEMQTTDGRRWKRRMDESDAYFRKYSRDWAANRALMVDFSKMIEEFGTYVAIAYPTIDNLVSDTYYRNPDPYIQDKNGDKDKGIILTHVLKSVHADCDTEREMKDALQDQAWAGFGGPGFSFDQKPETAGEPIMMPSEDPEDIDPETQEPRMLDTGETVDPTDQHVVVKRLSPWRVRFDPNGRRWDMSDHLYWSFDSVEYLGPLMRDPNLTDEDKARLITYYGQGGAAFSVEVGEEGIGSATGAVETDPEFIRVVIRNIWSRPDRLVYRKPFGASFTFTPRPWDAEWEKANHGDGMFPYLYMARFRIPEDQKNTEGFIGMPVMTQIRPHIENINKAQGLMVNGLARTIDIYVTLKGALENMAVGKIEDAGRSFRVLEIDPDALKKFPSLQGGESWKWDEVIQLLKTGDINDLKHMEFIDHEFAMIEQIIGQGPADRGGVADSSTATQSLGQQQGLARRMSAARADAGRHYNGVTKRIFLILQQRQTLPIKYQVTGAFNEKTWHQLVNPRDTLRDLDLHFEYATGSTEARTREQEFTLRERMANILMPVFTAMQDWRMVLKVAQDLVEPLNIIGSEMYFDDKVSTLVMQLLTIVRGLGHGAIGENELTADNAQVIQQIPELIAQIASALLTPAQLAQVEGTVKGVEQPDSSGGGTGSLVKPPTAGQSPTAQGALGAEAAAGRVGGILGAAN